MRPSSMRTGTSTWTSRNGCIRTCRMYCSRLIRLAARSKWLATMDFPDIVRDDWPVAVTAPPLKSGDFETAARQATRRVECFGQGVPGVDLAGATPVGAGDGAPPRVRWLRPLGHDERAGAGVEAGASDERSPQRVGQRAPDGEGG